MSVKLFEPIALRGVTVSNRIAVAPMCQYLADDGSANDWHLMHLGQFAMGAGGLVITEATHVSPEGRISPKCLGLYSDANEAALKRVIDFCRAHGVSHMGIQLAHAGRKASTKIPLEGGGPLEPDQGAWQTLAPSAEPYPGWHMPKAMDDGDLAMVKQQFVDATVRSERIGFDVIELHGAHGYLLHEFLSPFSNKRNDAYGGPLENRMRFPLEVFEACRAVWPKDKPMFVRVSASEWVDGGGFDPDEAVVFAKQLKALGCDLVHVSSGGNNPGQKIPVAPGYQVFLADKIKREADVPTMAVGLIYDAHQAEEIVATGQADMVALARGAMDDPRWAWHAAQALGVDTPYPAQYIRCAPDRWKGNAGQVSTVGKR